MTSRDFAFWLQGFFEIRSPGAISDEESKLIERHLALVFKHEIEPTVTPAERDAHDTGRSPSLDDLRRALQPGPSHLTVYC